MSRDHPRVCGEKRSTVLAFAEILGSPPRVRGKARFARGAAAYRGITPACAGKRPCCFGLRWAIQDHPRVCGEKFRNALLSMGRPGSPPRVRGKAQPVALAAWRRRITPACAGKRAKASCPGAGGQDHPRVCGEKGLSNPTYGWHRGSPPRVRGKADARTTKLIFLRITPACAGKSAGVVAHPWAAEDHPRVCGEKKTQRKKALRVAGSPPRVRGKGAAGSLPQGLPGITPACAGKSPRACGSMAVI